MGSAQVLYNNDPDVGSAGQQADSAFIDVLSRCNTTGADQPFGIGVKQGSTDTSFAALSSTTDTFLGLLLSEFTENASYPASAGNEGVKNTRYASVARRGRFLVRPEQAVTPADPVFVRATTAAKQVETLTPTAVNSTGYFVTVVGPNGAQTRYNYLSDSSATATEIVTGFKTAIAADSNAAVVATGSTTLILTANTAGQGISVSADTNMAIAHTTPNTTVGAFRKDYDGTAQVTTMTPTAVNSTEYQLVVDGKFYGYTSDSSATATEIVTGLTAAITADAGATVTPTGTTTLILTAKTVGLPFVAQGDANMAFAATTANAANAFPLTRCKWRSTASAAGALAVLELGQD